MLEVKLVLFETKRLKNRGMQIVGVNWPIDDGIADIVCCPDDLAAFHATTRQPHGVSRGTMIAPQCFAAALGGLSSAPISAPQHPPLGEQPNRPDNRPSTVEPR